MNPGRQTCSATLSRGYVCLMLHRVIYKGCECTISSACTQGSSLFPLGVLQIQLPCLRQAWCTLSNWACWRFSPLIAWMPRGSTRYAQNDVSFAAGWVQREVCENCLFWCGFGWKDSDGWNPAVRLSVQEMIANRHILLITNQIQQQKELNIRITILILRFQVMWSKATSCQLPRAVVGWKGDNKEKKWQKQKMHVAYVHMLFCHYLLCSL